MGYSYAFRISAPCQQIEVFAVFGNFKIKCRASVCRHDHSTVIFFPDIDNRAVSTANNVKIATIKSLFNGLEVGGTGPKVRPVVSCKGTTCTFGIIDTYGLSEKIYERFYKGYHDVKLPHKFKIGVGGCPNNCVKPDLNDIGIIGQRIHNINFDNCRACKTCMIEKTCPVKAASVNDNKKVNVEII